MLHKLLEKIEETLICVLPVVLVVSILYLTKVVSLSSTEMIVFLVCGVILVLGISLFSLGADMAMEPMGEQLGSVVVKLKKPVIMLLICLVAGFVLTLGEPDIKELIELFGLVSNGLDVHNFTYGIAIGVGIFLVLGALRILTNKDLSLLLLFFYTVVFALVCLVCVSGNEKLLALCFDAGGATTGALSVPFILTFGVGIAHTIGGRKSHENSFGLIALCSIGPIIVCLIIVMCLKGSIVIPDINSELYEIPDAKDIFHKIWVVTYESALVLGIVTVLFVICDRLFLHLPTKKLVSMLVGILCALFGSVMFLTSASIGFHTIAYDLGSELADLNGAIVVLIGLVIGTFISLSEPAVHMLAKEVENVTTGSVSKRSIILTLAVGVGISVALSMIRIYFGFSILYYLVPGYLIALGLMFFMPRIYTAIAFDSGGVASGPITLSFLVPFAIGACSVISPDTIIEDAFGFVAMVAMTPLISIQALGFRDLLKKNAIRKNRLKKITDASDEQIIRF